MNEFQVKEVKGYSGYYVTNTGRVVSTQYKNPIILKPNINQKGYSLVVLSGKRCRIHRLVAQHFIPNPQDLPFVCHYNGLPDNNNVANLYWGTNKTNYLDSVSHGTAVRGEKVGTAKLTSKQVKEIRASNGVLLKDIANLYDVTISTIWGILHRKSWCHI